MNLQDLQEVSAKYSGKTNVQTVITLDSAPTLCLEALPDDLKNHALGFVETYTPGYAAARLVCVDWSHFLSALPKTPWLVYDDYTECTGEQRVEYLKNMYSPYSMLTRASSFLLSDATTFETWERPRIPKYFNARAILMRMLLSNKSNPRRCIIYDEVVPEADLLLDSRNRALPAWPPRLRRLSRRRRAKRQQMFETFMFDLMEALDEAIMDAPARAASSRLLTAKNVY